MLRRLRRRSPASGYINQRVLGNHAHAASSQIKNLDVILEYELAGQGSLEVLFEEGD